MRNRIITINREFGSGGREIGKRLADILQIPYYDKEIVAQIAQRTSLAEEYVSSVTEQGRYIPFPITIGRSFYPSVERSMAQANAIYIEQSKILSELAQKSDCIIVGRCANYILREHEPLRIFVYAEMEAKMIRCRDKAPEHEHMTDRQLRQHIIEIDKGRANYYRFVTGCQWEDKRNYDMSLNTSAISAKHMAQGVALLYNGLPEDN